MKSGLLATLSVVALVAFAGCSGANDSPITMTPGGDDGGGGFDGTASHPTLALSAPMHDFGTLTVGQVGPPVDIVATNTGNAATGALKTTLGGANMDSFVIDKDGCNGQVLAPTSKCTVTMHFAPTSAGGLSATLGFADNLGDSANAALTGSATQPMDITLLPAMQDFGSVVVSAGSAPATFTLANDGMTDTGVVTLKLGGSNAEQFSPSMDTCTGKPLMAGARCSILVAFTPTTAGMKMATLTASVAGGPTLTSALSGLANTGAAFTVATGTMTVTSYNFGTQIIGSPGTEDFIVTNSGGVMSGVPAVTVSGANMTDFAVSNSTCTGALMPNGTCKFSVTFTPAISGNEAAAVGVAAAGTVSASVALAGQGQTPAALQASPASHQYGSVVQGGMSAPETFTITNTGKAKSGPLTVYLSGTDKGQFTIGTDSCSSAQLDGGGTCTVVVTFTPDNTASGAVHANLNVQGNPGGPASASLNANVSTLASLSIGPTPYDYGNVAQLVATTPVDFTVANGGSLPSGSPTVTLGGANAADFKIAADNCTGNAIPGNGACTVSVSFKPSTMAPESATLTVAASPGGAVTANLSGTGTTAASLQITPNPFGGFGDIVQFAQSGNKTFNVSNTGGVPSGPVVMSMAGMNSGDFHIVTDNCRNKTLPANNAMACTVIVYFKPMALGHETGSLTAVAVPGGTATDSLGGNGVIQGTLAVMPNPGAFGGVNKGTPSKPPITFQVSNTGGVASGVPTVSVTGPNMGDFMQTNNCTAAIPANTMNGCQIVVTFTPNTTMGESATLNIAANPGGTTVPLTGTGTQPTIGISPSPWNCDALPGQMTSQLFTVKNTGSGPTGALSIAGLPSNGFSIAVTPPDTCSMMTVGAGSSCTFSVQYAPPMGEALGTTDKATVTVSDPYAATDMVSASLTGQTLNGSTYYLQITPNPATFPAMMNGTSMQTFTVANFGTMTSPAFTPTVTPDDVTQALDFNVANSCMSTLGPFPATCTYGVTFSEPPDGGADGGPVTGFSGTTQLVDNPTTPMQTYAQARFTGGM
jgi:hypothetical protein